MLKKAMAMMALLGCAAPAWAGDHVHFAAFFATNGPGSVSYPDTVEGDAIEGPMLKRGAEMMLFAHSVSIEDGDVISLQNDTLRAAKSGDFKDFGLDCQLTLHTGGGMSVGGVCNVFVTRGKKMHAVATRKIEKQLVWYKVFEDKEQGVAGYFMKEHGADFASLN
ncbi:MAG: hypothetical protein R8K47_04795 [Mariprofundaceae bacterium]